MRVKNALIGLFCLLSATAAICRPASADVIPFTDETAFKAQLAPGYYCEDFSTFFAPEEGTDSPRTFTDPANQWSLVASTESGVFYGSGYLYTTINLAITPMGSNSNKVRAIGGEMNADSIRVTLSDNSHVDCPGNTTGSKIFRGFILTDPDPNHSIQSMSITVPDGKQYYPTLYKVYVGVPEPSTLMLLAAGLVSLLAYAWHRRRS